MTLSIPGHHQPSDCLTYKTSMMQDNLGAVGWELSSDDYAAISNITEQMRYFEGAGWAYTHEGPWHNYEELWNEPMPPDQP